MSEREDVFLVAVTVAGFSSRDKSQEFLISRLQNDLTYRRGVDSWWIAEDDRRDGSDNDSAVFCHKGEQVNAHRTLLDHEYTERHNYPPSHRLPPLVSESTLAEARLIAENPLDVVTMRYGSAGAPCRVCGDGEGDMCPDIKGECCGCAHDGTEH